MTSPLRELEQFLQRELGALFYPKSQRHRSSGATYSAEVTLRQTDAGYLVILTPRGNSKANEVQFYVNKAIVARFVQEFLGQAGE